MARVSPPPPNPHTTANNGNNTNNTNNTNNSSAADGVASALQGGIEAQEQRTKDLCDAIESGGKGSKDIT